MEGIFSEANVATTIIGAIVGYLGAVATFKAQFVRVDERHNALKEQIARDRESDAALRATELQSLKDTLARIERGQRVTLQLAADLARASGVKHRALGEDALARFLSENEGEGT